MLKEATKEINGSFYTIHSLPAVAGRSVLVKLFKLLGPTCAQALRGKDSLADIKMADLSGDDLARMIMELSERVSEAEFDAIVSEFLKSTQVHTVGKTQGPVPINPVFAFTGDYGSMFKWLAFSIEHNYASFLGELGITTPRT